MRTETVKTTLESNQRLEETNKIGLSRRAEANTVRREGRERAWKVVRQHQSAIIAPVKKNEKMNRGGCGKEKKRKEKKRKEKKRKEKKRKEKKRKEKKRKKNNLPPLALPSYYL